MNTKDYRPFTFAAQDKKFLSAVDASISKGDFSPILAWFEHEDARLAKARKARLDKEYKKSFVIGDKRFTILHIETMEFGPWAFRFTVRDIVSRRRAVIYFKHNGTHGEINYK